MTRSRRLYAALFTAALPLAACSASADSLPSSTTPAISAQSPDVEEDEPRAPTVPTSDSDTVVSGTDAEVPESTDSDTSDGVTPDGFTTATVRITKADGSTCDVCMWLADEAEERSRGLMGVTDLGEADAMVFVFNESVSGGFYMFQTVTALSIGWFGGDGAFVSSTDMNPCLDSDPSQCERFFAADTYQLAIEVFQGDLANLGIDEGSHVEIVAGTEAERCPLAG